MILMIFACLEPTSVMTEVIPYGDPDIEVLSYDCDPSTARWKFEATTDAWTANGNLWLYIDPVLEKLPHLFRQCRLGRELRFTGAEAQRGRRLA